MRAPIKGEFYIFQDEIFKVLTVSSGTDEVIVESLKDKKQYSVRYGTFSNTYEQVFKVKTVADWLNRSPRSIYRYETNGVIEKATMYPTTGDKMVRFYRLRDVFEMHELISQLHQGRPRKDGRTINNTMPDIGHLRIELKEKYER